jgi:hypothetical protein
MRCEAVVALEENDFAGSDRFGRALPYCEYVAGTEDGKHAQTVHSQPEMAMIAGNFGGKIAAGSLPMHL